ncbi:MAG: hypothetical protein QNJ36_15755, partial [Calothrix sp. MO_167.B42]|nr:hypothetical protein [Calothrix sp. MO_167.B42]
QASCCANVVRRVQSANGDWALKKSFALLYLYISPDRQVGILIRFTTYYGFNYLSYNSGF